MHRMAHLHPTYYFIACRKNLLTHTKQIGIRRFVKCILDVSWVSFCWVWLSQVALHSDDIRTIHLRSTRNTCWSGVDITYTRSYSYACKLWYACTLWVLLSGCVYTFACTFCLLNACYTNGPFFNHTGTRKFCSRSWLTLIPLCEVCKRWGSNSCS